MGAAVEYGQEVEPCVGISLPECRIQTREGCADLGTQIVGSRFRRPFSNAGDSCEWTSAPLVLAHVSVIAD